MNILDMLSEDTQRMWRDSWLATDASERAEARQEQAEREQRLMDIEAEVEKLRLAKLHKPTTRAEVFAKASAMADIADAREAARVKEWQRYGEPVDRDVSVKEHERAASDRKYIRRTAKDPAKIAELERELELRNREVEAFLWQRPSRHRPY
jgi:hypothetical protein